MIADLTTANLALLDLKISRIKREVVRDLFNRDVPLMQQRVSALQLLRVLDVVMGRQGQAILSFEVAKTLLNLIADFFLLRAQCHIRALRIQRRVSSKVRRECD